MRTFRLINSSVMPKPGNYQYQEIDADSFYRKIKQAAQRGTLVHNIGYHQNIDLINQKTGLKLQINKDRTLLNDGDEILSMSLKYRTNNKGAKVNEQDFQYGRIKYKVPLTDQQRFFIENLKDGMSYNFKADQTSFQNEDDLWKNDILHLQQLAKQEFGVGYQKQIAEKIDVKPQSINRLFSKKFSPTFKLLFSIVKAIGYKIKFVKDK